MADLAYGGWSGDPLRWCSRCQGYRWPRHKHVPALGGFITVKMTVDTSVLEASFADMAASLARLTKDGVGISTTDAETALRRMQHG